MLIVGQWEQRWTSGPLGSGQQDVSGGTTGLVDPHHCSHVWVTGCQTDKGLQWRCSSVFGIFIFSWWYVLKLLNWYYLWNFTENCMNFMFWIFLCLLWVECVTKFLCKCSSAYSILNISLFSKSDVLTKVLWVRLLFWLKLW